MPIKIQSGGGITSNKLVHPGMQLGRGSKGINPGRVSQVGASQGTHVSEGGYRETHPIAKRYTATPNFAPNKFGNEIAKNVGKGGPGTGRTVYDRGTQDMHGAPVRGNPPPAGELFPGWPSKRG